MRGQLSALWFRLEHSGLLPVLMVMVCIQGTVVLGQFLVALLLSPSELGVIRSLESALSVMVLVGSAGTQALSIRDIAAEADAARQMVALRNLYVVALLGASVVALAVVAARVILPPSAILTSLVACSGMVLLTNVLRATTGFAQGAGLVRQCYRPLMALSGAAIAMQLTLASLLGVSGWIAGRYAGEALTLAGLLFVIHRLAPPIPWRARFDYRELARSIRQGSAVNIALILRLLADTLPVLALTAFKVPTDEIGVFGLASLLLQSVTLPLAVLAQRALPLLVAQLDQPEVMNRQLHRLLRNMLLTAVAGALALSIGSALAYHLIGGAYTSTFVFTGILCWVLPVKALALAFGTHLMIVRRYATAVWINLAEVVLVGAVCAAGVPSAGADGAAIAMALGSVLSATLLGGTSLRIRRRSLQTEMHG